MYKFRVRWYDIEDMDDQWLYERQAAQLEAKSRDLEWDQVQMSRQEAEGRNWDGKQVLIEWSVFEDSPRGPGVSGV